jgi:hypothetical protein
MGYGIIQIVAFGAQDVMLVASPQMSYFQTGIKRHTNFAEESIEQTFAGPADFGKRVVCTISRNADLVRQIVAQVTLPAQDLSGSAAYRFRWLNYPGLRLLKKVEIEIGGQVIDRHYGEWMYIWHQLSCPPGSKKNFEEIVGNTHDMVLMKTGGGVPLDATCAASEMTNTCVGRSGTPAKTLMIPLMFWFCKNPGLALPLIALQYHEVKINVEFANMWEMAYWDGGYTPTGTAASLVAASLFVDYVYLDTDERRRMSSKSHEYLFEQLQFTGAETITSSSYKSRLNLNHPVKELIWVVQRDSFVTCSTTPSSILWIKDAGGAQPFNFSDDFNTDGLIMDVLARPDLATTSTGTGETSVASGGLSWYIPNFANSFGAGLVTGSQIGVADDAHDGSDNFITGTTNYLLAKLLLESGVSCSGKNPVEVAKIQLNGHERFQEREGRYFDVFTPWQKHTNKGQTGINVYSFGLYPEIYNPSGQLNFSRIDNATLFLTLSVNTVRDSRTAQLRVYATNYNLLRITSGMAGLSWAS